MAVGGTKDHLHVLLKGQIHKGIEQRKGKLVFLRLKDCPGKFRDADRLDTGRFHAFEVIPPQGRIPMLGIVANT